MLSALSKFGRVVCLNKSIHPNRSLPLPTFNFLSLSSPARSVLSSPASFTCPPRPLSSSAFASSSVVQTPSASTMTTSSNAWSGGLSQEEFMLKDECILVDARDQIIGHSNKYNCHQFIPSQPSGQLHRAFSVFLFDPQGRLLLQQRAHSKITFPGVWTNTCCSHQLYGFQPTEVDQPEDVLRGNVPGTVRAALRKLEHELGIPTSTLDPAAFKFLTRLHYCAGDRDLTTGQPTEWGEHEMDYILFVRAVGPVPLQPNPEEVADTKYVTLEELRAMMNPATGLRWSPWFRIIAERLLPRWWEDLDRTLTTDEHVDLETIHEVL